MDKMDKYKINVQKKYIQPISIPNYEYGNSQEGLDSKRLRNAWIWKRVLLTNNTVYLARSGGIVHWNAGAGATVTITGYVWNTSSPSTVVAENSIDVTATSGKPFICFPVQKWEYYKINSTSWLQYWYFTPTY